MIAAVLSIKTRKPVEELVMADPIPKEFRSKIHSDKRRQLRDIVVVMLASGLHDGVICGRSFGNAQSREARESKAFYDVSTADGILTNISEECIYDE